MKEKDVKALTTKGIFHGKVLHGTGEETHISWVVLFKSVVFKIKKPVKLSFLDFSTLRKRKLMCEREVRLNSRFTDIYQGVVPIRMAGSNYFLGGEEGKIIDYAVQLKRLMTARRMDIMLKKNQVSVNDIRRLANKVSEVHHQCRVVKTPFKLARARRLFNDILAESRFIGTYAGNFFEKIVTDSVQWSNRFLDQHQKRMRERIAQGFERDLHGDLHSGNIFMYRKPILFDCIEFKDSFRRIDVLYEVAFLCMDLEKYGKRKLADEFFQQYCKKFKCAETKEDIQLFIYFKCLRANVRSKVHVIGLRQAENENERKGHLREMKRYLLLMNRYLHSAKIALSP